MKRVFTTVIIICMMVTASIAWSTIIRVPSDQPTIQAAIDAAVSGGTVLVEPGIYYENITMKDGVSVKSIEGPRSTTINGGQKGTVVVFDHIKDTEGTVLDGFTITNGKGSFAVGIDIARGGGTIRNNLIIGNSEGIKMIGSFALPNPPVIENNVIVQNDRGGINANNPINSGGVALVINNTIVNNGEGKGHGIKSIGFYQPTPIIKNCIIWGNGDDLAGSAEATYSCIEDGDIGEGNISSDPLFVDVANDDYHLKPNSPCIDAGDVNSPSDPDCTRADIGAFYYNIILTVTSATADNISLSVFFSKDVKIADAENINNYVLESPSSTPVNLSGKAISYDSELKKTSIRELNLTAGSTFKITVINIRDKCDNVIDPAHNSTAGIVEQFIPLTVVSATADNTLVSVTFSKDVNTADAEDIGNYSLECPVGKSVSLTGKDVTYDSNKKTASISGLSLPSGYIFKITVTNMRDLRDNTIEPTQNSATGEVEDSLPPKVNLVLASSVVVSIHFSEDVNPVDATDISNYVLESPIGTKVDLSGKEISYDSVTWTTSISGLSLSVGDQFKITVNNVKDLSEKFIDPEYNFATGLVRGCSFPLNPGKWGGTTEQDKPVAFTVSDDGLSLLDFTITMRLGGDCTTSCDPFGACSTRCRVNVTPAVTIPTRIDVVNCTFQSTYEEVVDPGTDFKLKVTISGSFTSESTVEGKWEGEYPGDIRQVLPGVWQSTIASGSGTWSASSGPTNLATWDSNQDGVVDILDLVLVGKHFGEQPLADARADVNGDGTVDIFDLVLVGKHFGEKTDSGAAAAKLSFWSF